ncbi:hypothetical protein [Salipiger marinus]|uniref:hypothetical protein n=1 Tax=Salipiger marinus TaxID=555512 RepID=UPI001041DB84|nr:hypothetical protein [Salipiger marinus]
MAAYEDCRARSRHGRAPAKQQRPARPRAIPADMASEVEKAAWFYLSAQQSAAAAQAAPSYTALKQKHGEQFDVVLARVWPIFADS